MELAKVSWTVNDNPIPITDWSFNSIINGGYDRMSGTAREADWNQLPSSAQGQGAKIIAYTQGGIVVYEGVLPRNPQIKGGLIFIEAEGRTREVEKRTERLLFQSRDYQAWQETSDEPFDFPQEIVLDSQARPSSLFYKMSKDQAFDVSDDQGLVFWAPGVPDESGHIRRYAFTIEKSTNTNNFDLRTKRFTGPTGARTIIATHGLSPTNPNNIDNLISNAQTALLIMLRPNTTGTAGANLWVRLRNLRVNGLLPPNRVSDDNYQSWVCVDSIVSRTNYDRTGISTSPSRNVLPFDWTEGSWAEALDYLAMLNDAYWRVLDDRGSGPFFEYNKWSNSKEWFVSSHGADADLKPLELYDGAIVKYQNHKGRWREKKVKAVVQPGTGLFFEEELEDPQSGRPGQAADQLATEVAGDLAEQLSKPRYAGSVLVVSAKDSAGRDSPREVLAGDVLTISDWAPAESLKKQRILEVSQTPTEVTVNVEAQDSTALIARDIELRDHARLRRHKRKRRRRR